MKKCYPLLASLLLLFLGPFSAFAQQELPASTQALLVQHQLEWTAPAAAYRLERASNHQFNSSIFGLHLRKLRTDVFYDFIPTANDSTFVPNVKMAAIAVHLASNDEDAFMAAHAIEPAVIDSVYHADWAQTFFFPPKDAFNLYDNCQMTAIYRDGVGMAIIYLLFDEAPYELEEYAKSLRFQVQGKEQ